MGRRRDWIRLLAVAAELEPAEASHLWAAGLLVPYMLDLLLGRMWAPLFWVSLAQLLINVYPTMHLRMARHRVDRLARVNAMRRDLCPGRRVL